MMNGYPAAKEKADKQKPESRPDSPTSSESTSQSQKSTSSEPEDGNSTSSDDRQSTKSETSTLSTASSRTLRPRAPINYNDPLLKQLHGRPQIRKTTYPFHYQTPLKKIHKKIQRKTQTPK